MCACVWAAWVSRRWRWREGSSRLPPTPATPATPPTPAPPSPVRSLAARRHNLSLPRTLNSLTHMVRHRGSPIVPTASHTHAGQQGLGERRRHGLRASHQGEGHPPELARRAPRHSLVSSRPASEQEEGAARLGQDAAAAYVRCVPCMAWPGATADPPCASQSTSSCGSRPTPIARRRT